MCIRASACVCVHSFVLSLPLLLPLSASVASSLCPSLSVPLSLAHALAFYPSLSHRNFLADVEDLVFCAAEDGI